MPFVSLSTSTPKMSVHVTGAEPEIRSVEFIVTKFILLRLEIKTADVINFHIILHLKN